jgi:hypothetical protein
MGLDDDVYNSELLFGGSIWPLSCILETRKCNVPKLDPFPSSDKGGDDLIGYKLVENPFNFVSFVV